MTQNTTWWQDATFYHIYPLGLCDAPPRNDFQTTHRIEALYPWLDHMQRLGMDSLYLGPVFQSGTHGYDTIDYYQIDSRLGDNDSFAKFAEEMHKRGLRLVLDAVFNHVGRDFWAFKDVLTYGEGSAYKDWFHIQRFGGRSPLGDPFEYEGWQGHYGLVKLNLSHPHVRAHIFDAVGMWMDKFGIDGLRLDAADCIDFDFLRALHGFTKSRRSDFWLMGEVIHGDYRQWVNPATLDSLTNYECYKGLWSSLVDKNYFEIAYALNRQSGAEGIYKDLLLYNFVDNHDVDRVAGKFSNKALLYPLYILLFSMPGIPSIYYGSEFGLDAKKEPHSDVALRPVLDLNTLENHSPQKDLPDVIRRLAALRKQSPAIQLGSYQEMLVASNQLAFVRQYDGESVLVVLNSADQPAEVRLERLPWQGGQLRDLLNPGDGFQIQNGRLQLSVPPTWGRILLWQD
ncbi:MAG: alpha-glucosidase C-terminal domain-containing protein [Anaerolineaceae bacterium]|nr:alpha-glucosidase C-terminal domain-containing protein [Anaerolineaceae bacterium]